MSYGDRTFQDNLSTHPREDLLRRWNIPAWKYRTKPSVSRAKRWYKRVNNRIRRREERRDPEGARTRDRFFYWAD